jgi:protein-S-isoprenylcysteine O-methyltransferase Ste14
MKIWESKRNLPLRIRRIALIVLLFFARPVPDMLLAGLIAMILGSVILILAYSVLLKRDELATRGPYAFCRHPAYFGMLISGLGYCLATGYNWSALVISAAYFIISVPLYYRKIRSEEERLEEIHGEKFLQYTRRVKHKLIPSLISAIRNGGFLLSFNVEASIRNHSLKRVSKDCFWFLVFVAKWYYLQDFHPFGRIRLTGRPHEWSLTAALAAMLGFFLLFKIIERVYRKSDKNSETIQST